MATARPRISLGMRPAMRLILKNSEQHSHAMAHTSAQVAHVPRNRQPTTTTE